MTRRDYELLTDALRKAHGRFEHNPFLRNGVSAAAQEIAVALAGRNVKFDQARFLRESDSQ